MALTAREEQGERETGVVAGHMRQVVARAAHRRPVRAFAASQTCRRCAGGTWQLGNCQLSRCTEDVSGGVDSTLTVPLG
jgi:hypothetical protein